MRKNEKEKEKKGKEKRKRTVSQLVYITHWGHPHESKSPLTFNFTYVFQTNGKSGWQ